MITGFSVLANFLKLLLTTIECLSCKSPRPQMYSHWFSGSRDA